MDHLLIQKLVEGAALGLGIVILISGSMVASDWMSHERVVDRVEAIIARERGLVLDRKAKKVKVDGGDGVRAMVRRLGASVVNSGLFNAANLESMKSSLRAAGIHDHTAYTALIGAKIIGVTGMPAVFGLLALAMGASPVGAVAVGFAGAVLGLLAPEWSLRIFRKRYQAALHNAMADALDLMVICVDSGLGLESAIARVGAEMTINYPTIAREFIETSHDIQTNPDIEAALQKLAKRTGIEPMQRLSATLIQATIYGTPLSTALHTLSAEIRTEDLAKFEEKATKLTTKITVPLILFILPALMTVIVGPAVQGVFEALAHSHAHIP